MRDSDDYASMSRESGFDLIDAVRILGRCKTVIALMTTLSAVAGLAIALTATPIFRAEVVITERRGNGESGLSSLAGQLTGLGSLAAVSLSSNGSGNESHAVLRSRHLIEEFIRRNDLLLKILPDRNVPPVMWVAVKRFQNDVLGIHEDDRKGTITVAIEWPDPEVAARWANAFIALANDSLRSRAIEEAKRNVVYLNDQIARTDSVEIRAVMYDLVKSETKTLMLANARVDYAFWVVDPAVPPATRSRPQRAAIVLFAAVLGFFFSSLVGIVYMRLRDRRAITGAAPVVTSTV